MADPAKEIGAIVVRERERLGLRQDELALTAGVSTRVVHQVEHGKQTSRLDSVVAILSALGLTLTVHSANGGDRGEAE
jgi:HTH-type transcriptional regulator/antitoxin HipB